LGAKALGSLVAIAAGLLFAAVALPQECLIGSGSCEGLPGTAPGGGGGDGTECNVMADFLAPTSWRATDDYVNMLDHTKGASEATEDDFIIPVAMTFSSFSVYLETAPGGAADDDAWAITLRDDLASTDITCSITGTETSCEATDITHDAAQFSRMTILIDSDTGVSEPTNSLKMWITMCMDPT
jgi:hypothetical protein